VTSTEAELIPDAQARTALEAFITDNPELERLEGLLAQFNIFEAIGAVRHEVRHSDFLAYLLNPQENHGLGDAFLKRLLQKSLASVGRSDLPVTLIDLDFWNLDAASVQREWQRIDIFLRDEVHQFSVIIENKIDTGERNDQLARYYDLVRREFPNDRILALYLTKEGDDPTDVRYIPIGYGLVCEIIEHLTERRASTLGTDVRTLMTHYAQMLRRHIMSDTDIARLCGLIYQKHKAALDLIYEHRPNRQQELIQFVKGLVETEPMLKLGSVDNRRWRHCVYHDRMAPPSLNIMFFVFNTTPDPLSLRLVIGPGDEDIRRRVFEIVANHQPPFNVMQRRLTQWCSLFNRSFLTATDIEEKDSQEQEDKIRDCWEQFLLHDLPPIRQVLAEGGWIGNGESVKSAPLES
jgi:hypothetical protein